MRVGYELNIEQTQKLIMTPELRQAITVLQLSSLELNAYIQQQLQENPLLELREDDYEQSREEEGDVLPGKDESSRKEFDVDWEDYFHDSSDLGMTGRGGVEEQPEYSVENFLTRVPTLADHLLFQLSLQNCSEEERAIGEYLIGNIDDNGYLRCSIQDAAQFLGTAEEKVEEVLALIQTFDPPGTGGRNLRECLMIQVKQLGIEDDLLIRVIDRHLEDLARGKFSKMAQVLDVPLQEIQRVADIIKTLDPKPGRKFGGAEGVRYIVPDVVVEKVDGEYIVLVNDVMYPRIHINSAYRSVLSREKNCDSGIRRFVEKKLNAAMWLIRSIEQRRLTLYKVARCLVDLQRDFLDYGVKHLKPLNLKQVAEIVGLHESTVSRATSNKYIQTPQGVFEMKYFFSTGLSDLSGSMVSSESIKKMIAELVAAEDPRNPLNDQRISEILYEKGIKISRRTVAKYRDELGIPPIRMRKRY